MSRDDGFPVADVDSAYFEDSKMRDLWQRVRDPDKMARAVILHSATFLGSWRQGERITVTQAAPLWIQVDEELVGHLKAVKLLDRAGKITTNAWDKWFGPAFQRREAKRESGRAGGLASVKGRSSDASPSLPPPDKGRSSPAEPVRPSVNPSSPSGPTDRPSSPATRARGEKDGQMTDEERWRALEALSARFQAGEISELDYQRQRKDIAS